jgi:hypothetical protein
MLVARLLANLKEAAVEIVERFRAVQWPLAINELIAEIKSALPYGAIVPPGIDDSDLIGHSILLTAKEALT